MKNSHVCNVKYSRELRTGAIIKTLIMVNPYRDNKGCDIIANDIHKAACTASNKIVVTINVY